jgi:hypothetical protein
VDGSIKLKVIIRKQDVSVWNVDPGVDGKTIVNWILKKQSTRVLD